MQTNEDQGVAPSTNGTTFAALAGICVATGALSLIDAADGWQQVLTTLHQTTKPATTCPGQYIVPGWGDDAILVFAGAALVLLAFTAVATTHPARWGRWSQVTPLIALVPIALMWLDSLTVGGAPTGDCDGIGLSGAAGAALVRAGWLFFAAMVLCGLSGAWLSSRINHAAVSVPH